MKIGIYAGSFNPVHKAHLDIANKIISEGFVDKVIFVPAGNGYSKKGLVDGYSRYEMIGLAIEENDKISVSDIEIINNKLYSYQTLDYFKNEYKNAELYFVMGSDNLNEFHTWKRYNYILENYSLIVLLRDNQKKGDFKQYESYDNISFVEYGVSLSSTEIRHSLRNGKDDVAKEKLDIKVYEYIKEKHLYE